MCSNVENHCTIVCNIHIHGKQSYFIFKGEKLNQFIENIVKFWLIFEPKSQSNPKFWILQEKKPKFMFPLEFWPESEPNRISVSAKYWVRILRVKKEANIIDKKNFKLIVFINFFSKILAKYRGVAIKKLLVLV